MRATSTMKTAVLCLLVVSASTAVVATTVNYNGISLSDIGPFLAACRANQQGSTDARAVSKTMLPDGKI